MTTEKTLKSQDTINELPSQENTEMSFQNMQKNETEISMISPKKKNGYVKAIKYRDECHEKQLKPIFSGKTHINLKPTIKEGEDHISVYVTLELYKATLHWTVKDLNTGKTYYFDVRFKLYEDPDPNKYAHEINKLCSTLLGIMYLDEDNLIKFNEEKGNNYLKQKL